MKQEFPTVVATPYSGHGDASLFASPLLASYDNRQTTSVQAGYSSYDDRTRLTKQRRNVFGAACCCCCTLFLLLFFLIPRSPVLLYQSAVITTKPYQLVQTYKVSNNNPYSITLSNVNTVVSSYIYSGPFVGQTLFAFGNLQGSGQVEIDSTSFTYVNVAYNFTSTTPGLVAASVAQCSSGDVYVTQGTFDFTTAVALHDWHSVSIGTFGVAYKCTY